MKNKRLVRALSGALALTLVLSGTPIARPASAAQGVPDWVQTGTGVASSAIRAQSQLPSKFDLRERGVVTPVKNQGSWGTCWTFGVSAAAETSILSSMGTTYEKYKAATGTALDLSERHLAYFAMTPVSREQDGEQAGEGLNVFGSDFFVDAPFTGGKFCYATSLFASGAGPTLEAEHPYRGDRSLTDGEVYQQLVDHEEQEKGPNGMVEWDLRRQAAMNLMTFEDYLASEIRTYGSREAVYNHHYDELREGYRKVAGATGVTYSTLCDWSIPQRDANGAFNRNHTAGWVLKDGNVLTGSASQPSIDQIKAELYEGRGVAVGFHADQSLAGQEKSERYINSKTWAHYTFEKVQMNHAVCIVGWDDDYSRDNFHHTVYDKDPKTGAYTVNEALTAMTTPPGDGAWIVKNSWGSETEAGPDELGKVVNEGDWGIPDANGRHTGYFYLSYYDKAIEDPESFEFTTDLAGQGRFYTALHDYLPAEKYYQDASDGVMSSANVFETGDEAVSLKSLSTNTPSPDQNVDFAVYLLADDAKDPTDGTLAWRGSAQFEYAGFHRFDLDVAIDLPKRQRFAIVSTAYSQDATGKRTYGIAANMADNRVMMDAINYYAALYPDVNKTYVYATSVVGRGQSYRYKDGEWEDWSDVLSHLDWIREFNFDDESVKSFNNKCPYDIDNFSIKAYLVPTEDVVEPTPAQPARPQPTPVPTPQPAAPHASGTSYSTSGTYRPTSGSYHSSSNGSASEASGVSRLAGSDRYGTMSALVRDAFATSDRALVASGASFADALAASALAGAYGCPVVLTQPGALSAESASVLDSLGARDVTVVGGPAAVADAVVGTLGAERAGGADRYATAVEVMLRVREANAGSDTVIVATGSGFADALSVDPWAWRSASPILLALPDGTLRQDAVDAIRADAGIRRVILVGGASAVSEAVRDQLGSSYDYVRLGGADRYETSAKVATWAAAHGLGWSRPYVATGRDFSDALSAAAVCGKTGSVLLLADAPTDLTMGLLREHASEISRVSVAGGEAAVPASVANAIADALR